MSELAISGGPKAVTIEVGRRWPEILPDDYEAVVAVLRRGYLSGPKAVENASLEREYAAYIGVKHCLSLNSGTAALHCCMAAVGIRPGDEVIVPAFTFMATAMAVAVHGAMPVFCDVEGNQFNLDPNRISERITERTKAILPVHLHGMPADMDTITAIAQRHGLSVVEDTAQAHGSVYRGKVVGTIGTCAGTSLQETKNFPGGEGGLFITDDDDAYLAASRFRLFGEDVFDPKFGRFYWSHGLGLNYRNHELSAAFARSQLRRLDQYIARARENAEFFTSKLRDISGIIPPQEPDDCESVWYAYRIKLDPAAIGYTGLTLELRDRVMRALDAEGVPVMIWQDFPLSAHPVYRRHAMLAWAPGDDEVPLLGWDREEFPESVRLAESSFLIGPYTAPLAVQSKDVLEQYALGIAKVMDNLEALFGQPYAPIERRPPRNEERR